MRSLGLVLCLAVVGCLQPQLQPCGDLLCPTDAVCLPDHTCASKESVSVCMGMADGATCTTALFTGSCEMGVCRPPVCGDNIVSGSEQCDGTAKIETDCVSYGFDTGVPTCSDRCGLDVVNSCVRFGWERILAQPTYSAKADSGHLLVITDDRTKAQLYKGTTLLHEQTIAPDEITQTAGIDMRGGIAVVALYGAILRSDNDGPFVQVAVPQLDGQLHVAIGDDGSIYAGILGDTGINLQRLPPGSSTWQAVLSSTRVPGYFTFLGDTLYVTWDDGELQSWKPGGTFTHVLTAASGIVFLSLRPGGGYYFQTYNNGPFEASGPSLTITPYGPRYYSQIFTVGNYTFSGGDGTTVVRRSGVNFEIFNAPIYGFIPPDDKDLFIYGNGIYRFKGIAYANRDGSGLPAHDMKVLANGYPAFASTLEIAVSDQTDSWDFTSPPEPPVAIAGNAENDLYVALPDAVVHYTGLGNYTDINVPGTVEPLDIAWYAPASTLYVVGKAGLAKRRTGASTWTTLTGIPTTCDVFELALHTTDVYAVATCGTDGVIYKLAGTAWSEVHRVAQSLVSLSVDSADNLYATGKTTSVTRVAGLWNDLAGPGGLSISATKASDIWVAGGPDDLTHYDGILWSRVRIEGVASPQVFATDDAVYLCGASQSVLIR